MLLGTVGAQETNKFTHLGAWETGLGIHIGLFIGLAEKHGCNRQTAGVSTDPRSSQQHLPGCGAVHSRF
jgi:hypothetical protein